MKEREYWIDYLRSFIILMVVIHHALYVGVVLLGISL
jgi:fucose 4-O-acetylase-like acetyltransferase